jgi:hypothetical protein
LFADVLGMVDKHRTTATPAVQKDNWGFLHTTLSFKYVLMFAEV